MRAFFSLFILLLAFSTVQSQSYDGKRYWLQLYGGISDLGAEYNSPGQALEAAVFLNPGFWLVGGRLADVDTRSPSQPGENAFDFQFVTGLSTPTSIPVRFAIVSGAGVSAITLYKNTDHVKSSAYAGDDKYATQSFTSFSLPLSFQFQFDMTRFMGFGINFNANYNAARPFYSATAGLIIGNLQNAAKTWGRPEF